MGVKILAIARWKWARPDVQTYGLMVQRLAASLRVSDALRIIDYVSRVGVSSGEEVRRCTILFEMNFLLFCNVTGLIIFSEICRIVFF